MSSPFLRTVRPVDPLLTWLERLLGRGLHSSTFQLNLSALHGIGGARNGLCSPC